MKCLKRIIGFVILFLLCFAAAQLVVSAVLARGHETAIMAAPYESAMEL
jgi:NADH:ubiquinone oxidoreductase subunit 3 (subunit A)